MQASNLKFFGRGHWALPTELSMPKSLDVLKANFKYNYLCCYYELEL